MRDFGCHAHAQHEHAYALRKHGTMAPETIGYMAPETIGYMASETTGFYMASIGKRTSRSNSGLFVRHSLTYASRSIEIPLLLSPT